MHSVASPVRPPPKGATEEYQAGVQDHSGYVPPRWSCLTRLDDQASWRQRPARASRLWASDSSPFFLLEIIPDLLHTAGWAACFQGSQRPLRLWHLYSLRLAG